MEGLHQLKADAVEMKSALLRGHMRGVAEILGRSWIAKRATAEGVSNPEIDRIYDLALANGAWAGKISGAGGGGFMMFMTDPENRYRLIKAIRLASIDANPVHLTTNGAETWAVNS